MIISFNECLPELVVDMDSGQSKMGFRKFLIYPEQVVPRSAHRPGPGLPYDLFHPTCKTHALQVIVPCGPLSYMIEPGDLKIVTDGTTARFEFSDSIIFPVPRAILSWHRPSRKKTLFSPLQQAGAPRFSLHRNQRFLLR